MVWLAILALSANHPAKAMVQRPLLLMKTPFLLSLLLAALAAVSADAQTPTSAPEFKVLSRVEMGGPGETYQQQTIFSGGKIYDLPYPATGQVTVLDPRQDAFVLLDSRRLPAKKTVVPLTDLRNAAVEIRTRIDSEPQRARDWGADAEPQFASAGHVRILAPQLSYEFSVVPEPQPQIAVAFDTFTTWTARLNTLDMAGAPPFMRIAASSEMAKRGVVPTRVTRTLADGTTVHATHSFFSALSDDDRSLVQQIDLQLSTVPSVRYSAFRTE